MTKLYGIIGDPISHSLSAIMQNRALAAAQLDAIYIPFHVSAEELHGFIDAARRWPCYGFNVTIPHKRAVMPYLDKVTEEAQLIGAVNTVIYRDGRFIGANTDAAGYLRSLREEGQFDPNGGTAVILGAGGAAYAVVYGLLQEGIERIIILNRTQSHAQTLEKHFATRYPGRLRILRWQENDMIQAFQRTQLLVNTTSVGLNGSRFEWLPLDKLSPHCLVSDLVYRPRQTPLLQAARECGLRTLEGLGMLLFQGAASFELWTGIIPNIDGMREVLTTALDRKPKDEN